jgi:hypothetical protein
VSDATLRIRNLSIALEALSRVNGHTATELVSGVQEALMAEIKAYREEKEKETQWPHLARPAKPTPDDDIPF